MPVVLIGNKLVVRKQNFDVISTIAGVGVSGSTVQCALGAGIKSGELIRVLVRRTAGTAAQGFNVFIYDDVSLSEVSQIAHLTSTNQDRLDIKFTGGIPFKNPTDTKLYMKIVAMSEGHSFQLRILGEVTKVI